MAFPTVPWHPHRSRARRRPAPPSHLHTLSRVRRRFSLTYETVADMVAGVLGIIDVACTEVPRRPPPSPPPPPTPHGLACIPPSTPPTPHPPQSTSQRPLPQIPSHHPTHHVLLQVIYLCSLSATCDQPADFVVHGRGFVGIADPKVCKYPCTRTHACTQYLCRAPPGRALPPGGRGGWVRRHLGRRRDDPVQ